MRIHKNFTETNSLKGNHKIKKETQRRKWANNSWQKEGNKYIFKFCWIIYHAQGSTSYKYSTFVVSYKEKLGTTDKETFNNILVK